MSALPIDARILRAMRAAGGGGVSGAELAQALGISRAAVWARIQDLRRAGYEIHASPHLGYRLLATPDRLVADDIAARLKGDPIVGRQIQVFQELTSTSDVVERLARDGAREGVTVFAESQTRGRGRLGRRWLSPAGKGLWFSILLRPDLRPPAATQLTVVAAVALARAIRGLTGLPAEIKWPNDIVFGPRKAAGILTELHAELDHIQYVILGLGVDVNQAASDFPPELRGAATSLNLELGRPVDRLELAAGCLRELDAGYGRLRAGRFEAIADEWEALCTTLGRDVVITQGERRLRGRAEALDAAGALLIRTQHGRLQRIVGGDVTLE